MHRKTHANVTETLKMFMTIYSENGKRSFSELDPPAEIISQAAPPAQRTHAYVPENRRDYPNVRFWTKQEWKVVERKIKDSSQIGATSGPRGGTRAMEDKNVMMGFIEDENGISVGGQMAKDIREYARSIWRGFYSRGMAPKTWGMITKEAQEAYVYAMEYRYRELQYCEYNWKANYIATTIYPQWYLNFSTKTGTSESRPATKRTKTTCADADDALITQLESPIDGVDTQSPPQTAMAVDDSPLNPEPEVQPCMPSSSARSRPRARPLRDPL
jgi:hypothetical protein